MDEADYVVVGAGRTIARRRAVAADRRTDRGGRLPAFLPVDDARGHRVADASIMPTPGSGNSRAPSVMIGEQAAA